MFGGFSTGVWKQGNELGLEGGAFEFKQLFQNILICCAHGDIGTFFTFQVW